MQKYVWALVESSVKCAGYRITAIYEDYNDALHDFKVYAKEYNYIIRDKPYLKDQPESRFACAKKTGNILALTKVYYVSHYTIS